jgi:hypothetical protein
MKSPAKLSRHRIEAIYVIKPLNRQHGSRYMKAVCKSLGNTDKAVLSQFDSVGAGHPDWPVREIPWLRPSAFQIQDDRLELDRLKRCVPTTDQPVDRAISQ